MPAAGRPCQFGAPDKSPPAAAQSAAATRSQRAGVMSHERIISHGRRAGRRTPRPTVRALIAQRRAAPARARGCSSATAPTTPGTSPPRWCCTRLSCRTTRARPHYRRRVSAARRAARRGTAHAAHQRAHPRGLPHRRQLVCGPALPGRRARADSALAASPSSSSGASRRGSIRARAARARSRDRLGLHRDRLRPGAAARARRCGRHLATRRSKWRAVNVRRHRLGAARAACCRSDHFRALRGEHLRYHRDAIRPTWGRASCRDCRRSIGTNHAWHSRPAARDWIRYGSSCARRAGICARAGCWSSRWGTREHAVRRAFPPPALRVA